MGQAMLGITEILFILLAGVVILAYFAWIIPYLAIVFIILLILKLWSFKKGK